MSRQKWNTENLKEAIIKVHGDKYGFDKFEYRGYKVKVTLYCKIHKEYFDIDINHLLNGQGCPKCRYVKSSAGLRRTVEEVIAKAKEVHGNKYDYSMITEYKNDRIKYPIICPEHGIFYQAFNNHIKGKQGCPVCGSIKCRTNSKVPFEEFIERANQVHNNKYTYIESSYTGSDFYVTIVCPNHGEFKQKASNHMNLGYGCPKCVHKVSRDEESLYEYICELLGKENVKQSIRGLLPNNKELDIYVPSKSIAFEYDGIYWHSELRKDKNSQLNKTIDCETNGIRLFHIFEDEWKFKTNIIKSMIKNSLGLTERKIFGRKCIIKDITTKDAKDFLNNNHLQGYCPSQIRYGLFYENELVSVMTFGKSRHFVGNGKHEWELLRFANKLNCSVIGGASKLFKHFIKEQNPKNIVSYADRRWSNGNLYNQLGFTLYNKSKPNYYYVIKGKRVYRFNLRKSVLVKKYGCPENMSERAFCLSKRWYRIYDCGCLCYEWKEGQLNINEVQSTKKINSKNEIYDYCCLILGKDNVKQNVRNIISTKEIDVYIPSLKLAIEFNDLQNDSLMYIDDRNYHLRKLNLCKLQGIKLITIFEDEYVYNKDIVLSKITHLLQKQETLPKIMARKCIVKEISYNESNEFLKKNHIQGGCVSTVYLGAYYNENLVGVMNFMKDKNNKWELTRFASDNNYICSGLGGKLFQYFKKTFCPQEVKSFADRRWTINENDNVYLRLGFKFHSYIPPTYHYFNKDKGIYRNHKFNFRKQNLHRKYGLPLTMTESEIAKELGYYKIYDCGLIKYVWKKEPAD